MMHKLTLKTFALALAATAAFTSAISAQAAVPRKVQVVKSLAEITQTPTYLDGTTNHKFAAGSNAFSAPLKKDGSEELRALLRLNAGASKESNLLSQAPQKLHMSLTHVAKNKTVENVRLSFKGSKTSVVGTRVLTFESPKLATQASGRLVGKVQQELISNGVWKTTGTVVQFIPAQARF